MASEKKEQPRAPAKGASLKPPIGRLISVDEFCMTSTPCQHKCKIDEGGNIMNRVLPAQEIVGCTDYEKMPEGILYHFHPRKHWHLAKNYAAKMDAAAAAYLQVMRSATPAAVAAKARVLAEPTSSFKPLEGQHSQDADEDHGGPF